MSKDEYIEYIEKSLDEKMEKELYQEVEITKTFYFFQEIDILKNWLADLMIKYKYNINGRSK